MHAFRNTNNSARGIDSIINFSNGVFIPRAVGRGILEPAYQSQSAPGRARRVVDGDVLQNYVGTSVLQRGTVTSLHVVDGNILNDESLIFAEVFPGELVVIKDIKDAVILFALIVRRIVQILVSVIFQMKIRKILGCIINAVGRSRISSTSNKYCRNHQGDGAFLLKSHF